MMMKLFWDADANVQKLVERWHEDTAAAVRPHLADPHDRARVFTRWEHAYAHLMRYKSSPYNMGPAELYRHLVCFSLRAAWMSDSQPSSSLGSPLRTLFFNTLCGPVSSVSC